MSAALPNLRTKSTKEFSPFRLDTVNECLWRQRDDQADERIRLTPKAFAVLRYLAEHAGRLVTQSELLEAVWPDTFVQPEVLKSQILDVRQALGDDAKNPRYIETLPRRGYQFIAPIADVAVQTERGNEPPSRKLVGRDAPLDELRRCFRRSLGQQRQVVFVTGETGIGKTTLVDEFVRGVTADFPGIRVARGQCVEGYGSKEAYYPVLEALAELCNAPGGSAVARTLGVQAPTVLMQFPAHVTGEQRGLQEQIASSARERMLREMIEAMETISSEKPLLLVFEDLHWADPSTVDFISALARRRSGGKVMLIGTYRPVDVAAVKHPLKAVKQDLLVHQLCREIALEPLTEGEVAEYLAMETPGVALPDGLAALIRRYSDGNPLFMVSILDDLRRRGLIAVENGAWQIRMPIESIHLDAPESLREMIELQIESLSADERRVLELASGTGISFTANANDLGTTLEQEKFENTCEDLARRQHMVRRMGWRRFPDGTVWQCYQFAHVLYREVFYRRRAPSRWGRVGIEETPAHSFLTA